MLSLVKNVSNLRREIWSVTELCVKFNHMNSLREESREYESMGKKLDILLIESRDK